VTLTGALCVICHDRPVELRAALDSATDDWHQRIVVDMASTPPLAPTDDAQWLRSDENLGPTGGYNLLAAASTSDFLVFLDDDAVLRTPVLDEVAQMFSNDARLAVVAFKVVRADGSIRKIEQPFRGKVRDPDRARPCAYFLEGACAIRREAFDDVGGYDAAFVYAVEEVDFSFRLARRGWRLQYAPQLVVEHRPSPAGRGLAPLVPALTARNRILVARRYLPWPLAVLHGATWTVFMLSKAIRLGSVSSWWEASRRALTMPVDRDPLPWRTLRQLHRDGGRVAW
jgi:GT2 family glycosyltransferase